MGRRGCRASNRAGILSGWAYTLHETGKEGKGHGSRATQGDARREDEEPGQFPHKPEAFNVRFCSYRLIVPGDSDTR